MAQQPQHTQARTLRERIDSRRGLSSTIRSGSADSYGYARSGYVERPFGAGRDMQALAGALSHIDRSLGGYLDKKLEENIEQGTAEGLVRFSENPADNKNMQDWKAFVEANPNYANANPWVQKGYERARLQALGLDYEKGLNDAFVQSGLVNETDQTKVDAFFQNYDKQFREQHGINGYEDKITLASNFTRFTAAAKQGLYSRHSQYLQAQNETLLGQQYADLAVKAIDNLFDPAINGRTRSLANAQQHDDNMDLLAATVMQNVKAATDHGYTNAKAAELAAQMVFTAADRIENPAILEALDRIQINGVTLSSLPNVAAKVEQREQQRIEKQRADTRWYWAQQERQEKLEEKQTLSLTYAFSQSSLPATDENIRQWEKDNKVQIPRRLIGQFMKGVNEIHTARQTSVNTSPLVREELMDLRMRLRTGQSVSPREAMNASIQTGDPHFINAYTEMDEAVTKPRAESMKNVGSEVWRLLTKADEDLFSTGNGDMTELEISQRLGLEAKEMAHDLLEAKFVEYVEVHKGKQPDAVQRRIMEREVVEQTYTTMKQRQASLKAEEEEQARLNRGSPPSKSPQPSSPPQEPPQSATFTLSPEQKATMLQLFERDPEAREFEQDFLTMPGVLENYLKHIQP